MCVYEGIMRQTKMHFLYKIFRANNNPKNEGIKVGSKSNEQIELFLGFGLDYMINFC